MNKEMKNSGIEWIGKVPSIWKIERLQWHLYEINKKNNPIETTNILSLTNKLGVIPYSEKGNQGNVAKENYDEYKLAYPDTIVANSMNILIGSVGYCNYFGCVSPVYYVFKNNENSNLKFWNYLFQTQQFQKELRKYANGILEIRLRVSSNDILKRYVAVPSLEEQQKIVETLDKKIFQIDSLISNQEKQIEKIKEYKQSLITRIVTKGLNPNAEMKESGIEWIGAINRNYYYMKLKFLLSEPMQYGANESGEKYEVNCTRYIRITDIDSNGNLKDAEDNQYLSYDKSKEYILKDKDILFARSGGTVGKSFIYRDQGYDCSFAGYLIKAECNQRLLLPEYLYMYTQSSIYESWKNMIFIQATIQNIGAQKYSNMEIVVPPVNEQKNIVEYLCEKCSSIDRLIKIKLSKIIKLQELRAAIIYEYVTGKRQVM